MTLKSTLALLNCHYIYTSKFVAGADFIATPFVVEIPAGTTTFIIPNITIIDDNLNEKEEVFLLVARILGKAALNNASCFQLMQCDPCNNHVHIGGTRLRIRDDDGTS